MVRSVVIDDVPETCDVFRRVGVWHRFDGNLDAHLQNESATRATAHFSFTIVNKEHNKSESAGDGSTRDILNSEGCLFYSKEIATSSFPLYAKIDQGSPSALLLE